VTDQLERVRRIVERVSLRPGLFKIDLRVDLSVEEDAVRLTASLHAPDVHNAMPTRVHSSVLIEIDHLVMVSDDDVLDIVKRRVREVVNHELDEVLLVDGKQARDPHAKDRRRARARAA